MTETVKGIPISIFPPPQEGPSNFEAECPTWEPFGPPLERANRPSGLSAPVVVIELGVEDDPRQLRNELDISVQAWKSPILIKAENIKLTNRQAINKIVDDAEERILALEEDWDGEGSPAFEKKTLDAIRNFLFELIDESELSVVKQVWIVPFSGGSIDLQWQAEHFDLLINFCTDGNVTYYGKDTYGHSIRGDSRPKPGYISCWMSHASR